MMNRSLRTMTLHFILCLLICPAVLTAVESSAVAAQEGGADGLVTVDSINNVDDTVNLLTNVIEERGLLLARVVDHAANAESVGLELRPTKLILFGNPALGTQLMNNNKQVGIDLPQKYLVWEDENGATHVSYNSPQYLVDRYSLTGPQDAIAAISGALQNFASTVSLPAPETLPVTGASSSNGSWLIILLLAAGVLFSYGVLRQRIYARIGMAVLLMVLAIHAGVGLSAQGDNGLIVVDSALSVDETVARLQDEIAARDLNTMMVLDHAANATSVDQTLLPTKLILFGNPRVGTQLMQSQQTVAIDLPQKFLVWEEAGGAVHVAYNDPAYLGTRHAIADRDELLGRVSGILAEIASSTTNE